MPLDAAEEAGTELGISPKEYSGRPAFIPHVRFSALVFVRICPHVLGEFACMLSLVYSLEKEHWVCMKLGLVNLEKSEFL